MVFTYKVYVLVLHVYIHMGVWYDSQEQLTTEKIGLVVVYVLIIMPLKSTQTFLVSTGVTHALGSRMDMAMYFCQEGRHVWKVGQQ